jgi:WD40 repeat protein
VDVFVSYARADSAAVDRLIEDIQHGDHVVWFDRDLRGGEAWWGQILERIQACSVLVFALSQHSLRSQACRAELDYALALRVPMIPIQVGPVDSIATTPVAQYQVIDYREPSPALGYRVMTAIAEGVARRKPLPNPLPPAPEVPFAYLSDLGRRITQPALRAAEQAAAIGQLRHALRTEEDEEARADARRLLTDLRRHPECTYANAEEIDSILNEASSVHPAGRGNGSAAVPRRPRWQPSAATSTPTAGANPRTVLPLRALRLSPTAVKVVICVVLAAAVVILGLATGLDRITRGSALPSEPAHATSDQPPSAIGTSTVLVDPTKLAIAAPITERPLNGHTGTVRSVATAQLDGRPVIISGSDDRMVRVWDLVSGNPIGNPFGGHTASVISVATAQLDGRPVAISGSADQTVRVWDLATGNQVGAAFVGHTNAVHVVATTQLDGRTVVLSGSADHTVRVWDLATGNPVGDPVTGHTDAVFAVATAQLDGRTVVISGGNDNTMRVWDLATRKPVGDPLTGHADAVFAVATAQLDGRAVVISGSADDTARVWDLASGDPVGQPFTGHADWVFAVPTVQLDGRPVVVSGSIDRTVQVWDLGTRALVVPPLTGHTDVVFTVAIAQLNGRTVVISGSGDQTVRTWDLTARAHP